MIPGHTTEPRVMVLVQLRHVILLICSLWSHYCCRWRKQDSYLLHRPPATTREPASIVVYLSVVGTRMMALCKSFIQWLDPYSAESLQRRAPKTCKQVKSSMSLLSRSFRPQAKVKNTDFAFYDPTKIACWLKAASAYSL